MMYLPFIINDRETELNIALVCECKGRIICIPTPSSSPRASINLPPALKYIPRTFELQPEFCAQCGKQTLVICKDGQFRPVVHSSISRSPAVPKSTGSGASSKEFRAAADLAGAPPQVNRVQHRAHLRGHKRANNSIGRRPKDRMLVGAWPRAADGRQESSSSPGEAESGEKEQDDDGAEKADRWITDSDNDT